MTRCRLLILAALIVAAAAPGRAVDRFLLDEDQIKAGFLFNFMRFIEWPDQAFATAYAPITACIVGDTAIASLLTEAAAGKPISGRSVVVKRLRAADDLRPCHLIFIASADERQAQRILESPRSSVALTVGQSPSFLRRGVINFVIQENKVKLELNLEAATRANLKVSARLVAVSRLVNTKASGGE